MVVSIVYVFSLISSVVNVYYSELELSISIKCIQYLNIKERIFRENFSNQYSHSNNCILCNMNIKIRIRIFSNTRPTKNYYK